MLVLRSVDRMMRVLLLFILYIRRASILFLLTLEYFWEENNEYFS